MREWLPPNTVSSRFTSFVPLAWISTGFVIESRLAGCTRCIAVCMRWDTGRR